MRATQTPDSGLLRGRVPNPPMCFVGREKEASRLAKTLETSPVALVCGKGGMGKSALVRYAVRARTPEGEGVQVRVRPGDDFGLFAVELALAGDVAQEGSPERIAASCLSAMESRACLVVVEDLHHLPAGEAARWLSLLIGYAHRSRWLLTSRTRSTLPDLQERIVEVGPLAAAAARTLAQACRPEADEVMLDRIVEAGGGSPLWIRQLSAAETGASDLLADFHGETERGLAMLSVLREPVARSSKLPLEALQSRGLFDEPGSAQLHDAVRERVVGELSRAELTLARQDAVQALGEAPRQGLERLRLLLEMGDFEAAAEMLAERRAWIDQGHGARLWSLLAYEEAPRLRGLRMHVARDVGSNTALNWLVNQPEPEDASSRHAWLEGLLLSGRPRRALEAMESSGAHDAPLLYGRALADAGHARRALEHLRSVHPTGPVQRAQHTLAMAKAHYYDGGEHDAAALLSRVRGQLVGLPARTAEALEAEAAILRSLLGLSGNDAAVPRSADGLMFRGLRLATSGRLERSSKLIKRLIATFDLPSGSGVMATIMSGMLAIARGEYRGLDGQARRAVHDAERLGNATLYHAAYILERVANLGTAWESDEIPWATSIPAPTGAPARYLAMARACHRARRGDPLDEDAIPQRRPSDGPLMASLSLLSEAHVRLLRGDPARACFLASQATEHAEAAGFGLFVGESVLHRVYADLALGRRVDVERGSGELLRVAERIGSDRYRVIASLLRLAVPPEPDVGALFRIAEESHRSPTAARVAASLLGAETRPDALDRLLTSCVEASWTECIEPLVPGQAAAWVVDPAARRVHTQAGSIELSPLSARLLDGLFSHDGHATLPELARIGWDLDAFHPLRDSKRIHVAIRRLRERLEEDPSNPQRLVTTDHGYGFGTMAVGRRVPRTP
ncbi:MAG: hypothetical protein AB8I08_06220 [Sandaracinaceae bacterium]